MQAQQGIPGERGENSFERGERLGVLKGCVNNPLSSPSVGNLQPCISPVQITPFPSP